MAKCKNCGGSGDRFVLEKGTEKKIVAFKEIAMWKKEGWIPNGETIECGTCHGFGVQER
jgi:hypothetical protein